MMWNWKTLYGNYAVVAGFLHVVTPITQNYGLLFKSGYKVHNYHVFSAPGLSRMVPVYGFTWSGIECFGELDTLAGSGHCTIQTHDLFIIMIYYETSNAACAANKLLTF